MSKRGVRHRDTIYVPHAQDRSWIKVGLISTLIVIVAALIFWNFLDGGSGQENLSTETDLIETAQPFVSSPSLTPTPEESERASSFELGALVEVISVTDGDTIRVRYHGSNEPVRFIGIDTPEVVNERECFGSEASSFTSRILEGKKIYLVRDGMQDDRDRYGRLLRFVFLEDQSNFNVTLVREGFATFEKRYPVAEPFRTELSEAQDFAIREKKGLWSSCR